MAAWEAVTFSGDLWERCGEFGCFSRQIRALNTLPGQVPDYRVPRRWMRAWESFEYVLDLDAGLHVWCQLIDVVMLHMCFW